MSQAKWQVMQWAGRLAKYGTLAKLSDKFGFGFVTQPPTDPEEGEPVQPEPQRVRFLQWFGFRSRPKVTGGECVVVAPRGGPTNALVVACDNLGVGPTNLKEGESVQYGAGGLTVLHDQAGNVVVNGGSLRVARETDPCRISNLGALAVWMNQVEVAINVIAPGTVVPLSAMFLNNPGILIADGAPKLKA